MRVRDLKPVKRLIVFDLDGTLAESKSVIDPEMAGLIHSLHGVSETSASPSAVPKLRYSAGLLALSEEAPEVVRYRSPEPVLAPELLQERQGTVANVVFPTATGVSGTSVWDGRT